MFFRDRWIYQHPTDKNVTAIMLLFAQKSILIEAVINEVLIVAV